MNSPAAPKPESPAFDTIIAQAQSLANLQRSTAYHALQMGVIPDEILSYARGNNPDGFESVLAHSAWAMDRVVALTKAQRRPESLGAKLLASVGHTDPYVWGIKDTGDRDFDLAALLNRV
jgi:hypothetical protein